MGLSGVLAGQQRQPRDRVLVDAHQPCGLADAAPLGEVLQDRQSFWMRARASLGYLLTHAAFHVFWMSLATAGLLVLSIIEVHAH